MRYVTALFCLLALPLVAQAQPIELTGTDMVRFWWPAATGPVAAYEAKLVYLDGTESTPQIGSAPPRQFTPRKGIAFKLAVRACTAEPDTGLVVCEGEWSEPSVDVRLCPLAGKGDADCSLSVGMSDFGILLRSWGETAE